MSASSTAHRGLRGRAGALAARVPVLVDLYRFVRNPAWARAISRDLARTRTESAFLADVPASAPEVSG